MVELANSYPNPPVIQVASEIRFPIQLSMPLIVVDFQKHMRNDFPNVKQGERRSATFDITSERLEPHHLAPFGNSVIRENKILSVYHQGT